jgi:hypothetical protein
MTEQELRALVRDVIATTRTSAPSAAPQPGGEAADPAALRQQASHGLFVLPAGDGSCIIEPTVACNHCGYCKSYGH